MWNRLRSGDFARTAKPIRPLVGDADELFVAERFLLVLRPVRPDVPVEILPGERPIDMISHPDALHTLQAAFEWSN